MQPNPYRGLKAILIVGLLAVVLAACTPPASPVPATSAAAPAAAPIPEVAVEASDSALTMPSELPAGLVAVTVNNSGEAPHAPLFARLNEGVPRSSLWRR